MENEGSNQPLLNDAGIDEGLPLVENAEAPAVDKHMDAMWTGARAGDRAAPPLAMPAIPESQPGLIQPPYPAPQGMMNIPDLPDASLWWSKQKPLMVFWMSMSVVVVLLSLVSPNLLTFVAGVLGIVGSSLHICTCCGGSGLAGPVKAITVLGYVSLGFCASSLLLRILLVLSGVFPPPCGPASPPDELCMPVGWVIFTDIWVVGQVLVSGCVAQRGHKMRRLLNPVTTGVVVLGQP